MIENIKLIEKQQNELIEKIQNFITELSTKTDNRELLQTVFYLLGSSISSRDLITKIIGDLGGNYEKYSW